MPLCTRVRTTHYEIPNASPVRPKRKKNKVYGVYFTKPAHTTYVVCISTYNIISSAGPGCQRPTAPIVIFRVREPRGREK